MLYTTTGTMTSKVYTHLSKRLTHMFCNRCIMFYHNVDRSGIGNIPRKNCHKESSIVYNPKSELSVSGRCPSHT